MAAPSGPRRPRTSVSWWVAYRHWSIVVVVVWLALAAVQVPVVADTALVPASLMPLALSFRGPRVGSTILVVLRVACVVVALLWTQALHPDYNPRGTTPRVGDEVPKRAEFWGQVAAFELLLLVVVEVAFFSIAAIIARRQMGHRDR